MFFKTLSFPLPVLYRGTMEADREPIAAVDTAKQRVIDASRECAMAAVGGRFNGSLRAALSSNLFPSATRHHVNQAFKMIMASPAMIAACETAERERTAPMDLRLSILLAVVCSSERNRHGSTLRHTRVVSLPVGVVSLDYPLPPIPRERHFSAPSGATVSSKISKWHNCML